MGSNRHLSYANVMATIAVFIALGGGALAVSIGKNDVGSREIAKNAVRSGELKNDTAKGKDVDESSLGQVPSAANATSAGTADQATTATNAGSAANAEQLGGVGPNGFIRYGAPIPSGVTIRGVWATVEFNDNGTSTPARVSVSFPAPAPVGLTDANVNFADTGFTQASDEDPSCTGTPENPTAPAGKVCIYPEELFGTANSADGRAVAASPFGFYIHAESTNVALESQARGTWAYTAP